jgi:aspartate/methionine/tyrosine aminotransferase
MVRLSHRLPYAAERNRLTERLDALRAAGERVIDLTETNPTRVGLPYPGDLLTGLASSSALHYAPDPFGLASARDAVAADYARRGAAVDSSKFVLTAGTSEAYTWLFKLLCDPGEAVLVPRPSYPLFEHLARLEGVRLEPYDLEWHGRWDIDTASLPHAAKDVRALVVVTPNNPTGSCISTGEFAQLTAVCADRGWALIADEVFVDYLLEAEGVVRDVAAAAPGCLTISLGGLSKSVGLPQLKLGWMTIGGPEGECHAALTALELIADSFLSVSTPVQTALPDLLTRGAVVREAIHERVRTNLSALRQIATRWPQCDIPRVDGGWSAVVRIPATRSEETLVLDILERERILVHPGFFFDFRREAFLVISLLVEPHHLREAFPTVLAIATE